MFKTLGNLAIAAVGTMAYMTKQVTGQIIKDDQVIYPIYVYDVGAKQMVQSAFSFLKSDFSVSRFMGESVPQVVYDIFNNQTCADIGSYDPNGYNFDPYGVPYFTGTWFCTKINDVGYYGCAAIGPSMSWCPTTCSFYIPDVVLQCFENITAVAYKYVVQEQHVESIKSGLIAGGIAGAAVLLVGAGLWAAKRYYQGASNPSDANASDNSANAALLSNAAPTPSYGTNP